MTQIFMLIALYLAVVSGPLLGGAAAGYRAAKKWIGERGATASSAAVVSPAAVR